MACSQSNNALSDIEGCISELKKCFCIGKLPINDDNIFLHHLEEKLELILQLGLKDKPGIFGSKRSYWDYISACFNSSKRPHQGIIFVNSNTDLKTSIGCGRAFLRFCLMEKSLADTLHSCFIDQKTTREFYSDQCLLFQTKLWSPFVTSLYDLNEINFDLNPHCSELDVSWPTFARKIFSSETEALLCRNVSSSHHGCALRDSSSETDEKTPLTDEGLKEARNLAEANSVLEANVRYLQKKCEILEKEICDNAHGENTDFSLEEVSQDLEIHLPEALGKDEFKEMSKNFSGDNFQNKDNGFIKDIITELNLTLERNTSTDSSSRTLNFCNPLEVSDVKYCLPRDSADNTYNCGKSQMDSYNDLPKYISNVPLSSNSSNDISQNNLMLQTIVGSEAMKKIDNLNSNDGDFVDYQGYNESSPFNDEVSDSIRILFSRIKLLIDDLRSNIELYPEDKLLTSHLNDLKIMWDSLETSLFVEFKKIKDVLIQKENLEELTHYIKSVALRQEGLIDSCIEKMNSSIKENECLYDKICYLKDKLHSYGLLKIQYENNLNIESTPLSVDKQLCLQDNGEEELHCNFKLDGIISDEFLQSLCILKTTSSKLNSLSTQANNLHSLLESSHKLNNNLISRVQDHEMHMKGITKELEEAHQLLSVMRKQHQKLQSAENIVKYDLQEKRKLITRLKQQLETTREDCNIVRLKNSKSEVEWQNLRKEFVQRHKQTSEESGFVDDKGIEDNNSSPLNSTCEQSLTVNNVDVDENLEVEIKNEVKKSRLELLEEQCQILCANLLNSSKKRQEIDSHLEILCKGIEKSNEERTSPVEHSTEECNHVDCKDYLHEIGCEKSSIYSTSDANSLLSSEIESFNSYSCSCVPFNSSAVPNDIFSVESLKENSTPTPKNIDLLLHDSVSISDNIQFEIDSNPISAQVCSDIITNFNENEEETSFHHPVECKELDYPSKECSITKINFSNIPETCLVESPVLIEFQENPCTEKEGIYSEETTMSKDNSELPEENRILQARIQELEKENLVISNKLMKQTLIETAKEKEISALEFQLNTQVLKYEEVVKMKDSSTYYEFNNNNNGLKNVKQKVSNQEQVIYALEEALAEIQIERENEKDRQWEELEDFKRFSLRDKEAMETEILSLQNYSKELKKKVIKLLKQKDILWKMNDHLTYLQKIQIDDRWMDDHEVSECLGCKSQFSFILRKHHCRQCGRIFCNSCSNNWLLTPSSRKQIRVCNECYMQHIEMKQVVRRNSNFQCSDDDSDNEASTDDMDVNLNRSNSLNSGLHPYMTDSILSLPVLQMNTLHQKNQFSSAPDLHMLFENENISENPRFSAQVTFTNGTQTAESGISGDLIIKSREEAVLPILCESNSCELHWSFNPYEAIPITLVYEDTINCSGQKTVLHQSACEIKGVIHLSLPGVYNFHFDNRPRSSSIVVNYDIKNRVTEDQSMCR